MKLSEGSSWKAFVTLLGTVTALALCQGCAITDADDDAEEESDSTAEALAIKNGAGAGPERFAIDPCENPRAFAQKHDYNLIVMRPGQKVVHGTKGRDLIIGTDGDDVIWGEAGDDVICAGYGEDTIHGGPGDDYIDGGGDNDLIYGDEGNDIVHGRGGSDEIHGGRGDDLLFGDILDDRIYGEAGDDLLIGGHGTDVLDGGPGNDFLRGDTGGDYFIGGPGVDVVSFMTAMPPGQSERVGGPKVHNGVTVDFTNRCEESDYHIGALTRKRHQGCANGDGGREPLDEIEIVIGSPYDDVLVAGGSGVKFIKTFGEDKCDGKPCGKDLPDGAGGKVFVTLDRTARDTGLIVRGTNRDDSIDIIRVENELRVRPNDEKTTLYAGPGCKMLGDSVACDPKKHVARYLAAWMGAGDDVLKVADAAGNSRRMPNDFTAHASGGDGSDVLSGGEEEDVFFTGPTGRDVLRGGGGDDALLSESRKHKPIDCSKLTKEQQERNPRCYEDKPRGNEYDDGGDELYGGPGDDQLVSDYPCGKHLFSGGGGKDIAGFARSGFYDIKAQLNGRASVRTNFHGRAFNPQLCGVDSGTRLVDDLEILEGADGDDELWGNDKNNTIWGREGNDEIHGLGGNDNLKGLSGNDKIFGGAGNDDIQDNSGNNTIREDAD